MLYLRSTLSVMHWEGSPLSEERRLVIENMQLLGQKMLEVREGQEVEAAKVVLGYRQKP